MNKNPKAKTPVNLIKKPSIKTGSKPEKDLKTSLKSTPPSAKAIQKKVSKDSLLPNESLDLSNDAELDTLKIEQATNSIKSQLLESLQVFKNANSEYIGKNCEVQQEVDQLHKGFNCVKSEVNGLLWESCKSKEGLVKMKHFVRTPKRGRDGEMINMDLSSVKSEEEALLECLRSLQEEIGKIKEKIDSNEEELKGKETQNVDLRDKVFRLRDSIMSTPTLDAGSKGCCVIY